MPMPQKCSKCVCCFVILIDFVCKMDKTHCSQVLFEECKYIAKEKELKRYVVEDVETSSEE